jgi:hypothetical protein
MIFQSVSLCHFHHLSNINSWPRRAESVLIVTNCCALQTRVTSGFCFFPQTLIDQFSERRRFFFSHKHSLKNCRFSIWIRKAYFDLKLCGKYRQSVKVDSSAVFTFVEGVPPYVLYKFSASVMSTLQKKKKQKTRQVCETLIKNMSGQLNNFCVDNEQSWNFCHRQTNW